MTIAEIENEMHILLKEAHNIGNELGYKSGVKDTKAGLSDLRETYYQEGLYDCWECFKRIVYATKDGGISVDNLCKMFGSSNPSYIVRNFSPSEVIQKFKDYEEQQKQTDAEIRVGDEVYAFEHCDLKRIVIYINDNGDVADTLLPSGMIMSATLKDLTKTGKHYSQIEEVLKELRGDEE